MQVSLRHDRVQLPELLRVAALVQDHARYQRRDRPKLSHNSLQLKVPAWVDHSWPIMFLQLPRGSVCLCMPFSPC